jgi:hypothetical protein
MSPLQAAIGMPFVTGGTFAIVYLLLEHYFPRSR